MRSEQKYPLPGCGALPPLRHAIVDGDNKSPGRKGSIMKLGIVGTGMIVRMVMMMVMDEFI